jgi:WD40 repeat protein
LWLAVVCVLFTVFGFGQARERWADGGDTLRYWLLLAGLPGCAVLLVTDRASKALRRLHGRPSGPTSLALRIGRGAVAVAAVGLMLAFFLSAGAISARPAVECAGFSPDGAQLAAGCSDGRIRLFDPATGKPLRAIPVGPTSAGVGNLAWSPGGDRVVVDLRDVGRVESRAVLVADVRSGEVVWSRPAGARYGTRGVAWSPVGNLVAWADEADIKLADPMTGDVRFAFPVPSGVSAVVFSPDGGRLAAAGNDPAVRVWDLGSPGEPTILVGHPAGVTCLAWSPDGHRLASGGYTPKPPGQKADARGDLRVWDAEAGRPIAAMPESHQAAVRAVAFSRDGDRLASVSAGGTVKVWDDRTGELVADLSNECDGANGKGIAWSADGPLAVAAGDLVLLDSAARTLVRRTRLRRE